MDSPARFDVFKRLKYFNSLRCGTQCINMIVDVIVKGRGMTLLNVPWKSRARHSPKPF